MSERIFLSKFHKYAHEFTAAKNWVTRICMVKLPVHWQANNKALTTAITFDDWL